MKKLINFFSLTLIVVFSANTHIVYAEEVRYVSENLSAYLRSGAGEKFKITGTIQAGEKVELLEEKDNHSFIRDSRNRKAWILSTDLSTTPSGKEYNKMLETQIEYLNSKLNNTNDVWEQHINEVSRRAKHAELQSSNLLEQNALLKRELESIQNKAHNLETVVKTEKQEVAIRWFIYTGSSFLIGLLFGIIIPQMIAMWKRSRQQKWS